MNKIVDEVVRTNASSTKTGTAYEALETMSRCATVTVDSTDGFPRTFIVDFGAAQLPVQRWPLPPRQAHLYAHRPL